MKATKILAVLLVAAMMLSCMSFTAFADEAAVVSEAKIGDVEYETIEAAFIAANEAGTATIELLSDVVIEKDVAIERNSDITILGNGKTIGLNYVDGGAYAKFSINGIFNLGVKDGGDANKLTITSANAEKKGMHWFNVYGGTVNMYDGVTITGIVDMGSDSPGAPIFLYSGKFNMYGGEISDCKDDGGGYFTFAGAIFMEGESEFNMRGGKISENSARFGGAVYMNSAKSVFNLYDGAIVNNHATEGGAALGSSGSATAYQQFGGGFNIYGGVINGNTADIGGAIDIGEGVLNMQAGEVTGNTTQDGISFTKSEKGTINISGGVFDEVLPEDFIADGFYYDAEARKIRALAYKVIDTAQAAGIAVELDDSMLDNIEEAMGEEADPEEVATYMVKLETADKDMVEKLPVVAEGKTREAIDVSVVKVVDGKETEIPVKDQLVTVTLENAVAGSVATVYHVNDEGVCDDGKAVMVTSDKKVTFTASSFSTYAFDYVKEVLVDESETAEKVEVKFVPVNAPADEKFGTASEYYIVIASTDGKKINRLSAVDLTFTNSNKLVVYTIAPASNVALTAEENGRYMFNFDGVSAPDATASEITIGTLSLEGYGEGKIAIADVETNLVNTALVADNIVRNYKVNGLVEGDSKTGDLVIDKTADYNIIVPKKELTVKITFNNGISDNIADYQQMKVVFSGGDLDEPITRILGTDSEKFDYDNQYIVEADLTLNNTYTVTVSGEGYRTASHTVTMTENKTINFWNNVMDNDTIIEEGKPGKKVTFLAGDIVKDNNINIYDLSAVVSYFGEDNLVADHPGYAKYDLNRDGKIDSKDVAYVLVSWGK